MKILRIRIRDNQIMVTVHMSEAEFAQDLHAVLAKVQQGVDIVIEQDHRPIAVLWEVQNGRTRSYGSTAQRPPLFTPRSTTRGCAPCVDARVR